MKKKNYNLRSLLDKLSENSDWITNLADTLEKENRERTDKEDSQYKAILRENEVIRMKLQVIEKDYARENPNARAEAETKIRDNAKNGRKTEFHLVRDVMMVSDFEDSAIIPLNVQDLLKPLIEGFILDKLGLPFPTGLAGDYVWPMYEMVTATVLGEGATLSDTKIPFSKLQANPARCGIACPVTSQSLNQTDGILERVVKELMPKAIRMLLNKIVLSTEAVNEAANTAGLVGPFKKALETKVVLSPVPTFRELNAKMKAAVLSTGIDGEALCWTMSKSMQAILEGEPINSGGIFVPMVQNDNLCGLPIYTSNEMTKRVVVGKKATVASGNTTWSDYTIKESDTVAYKVSGDSEKSALAKITGTVTNNQIAEVTVITEYIGLGDWRYQPMGLFGDIRFIVDPYSKAREDSVDFVLNCDYGTKTLRPEAFLIGEVSPVPAAG